jgi:NAD(P)H-dependent FMN reductase
MPITVLALSGSLRKSSSNTTLLEAARRVAPTGVSVTLYDGLASLPHFNPDIESTELPPEVQELRRLVGQADGLLISSPEYAHGVPGSLKNALDWLVGGFEFIDKPIALLNPSPHSRFAHPQLRETAKVMSGRVIDEACITLPIAGHKLDARAIADHPELGLQLREAMQIFCDAISSLIPGLRDSHSA